ncbi:unnamed protein product [Linum tenue]|nr:unnamed protein product [Linum tenue]
MDLIVSCSCSSTSSSLFRPKSTPLQSPFFPSIPNPSATSSRRLKWAPPRTKSELQTPVGVNGRSTTVTPTAVPTHKVTVHDRQRGVVHEFVVPEVRLWVPPPPPPLHLAIGVEVLQNPVAVTLCFMRSVGMNFLFAGSVYTAHSGIAGHYASVCMQA